MDKKTQLILAAAQMFGERDFHTTSVQDIVEHVGVSKGTFYQYFQSKEELLHSVFSHYFDSFRKVLDVIKDNTSLTPKERFIQCIQIQCELVINNKSFLLMLLKGTAFTVISDWFIERYMEDLIWFKERIEDMYGDDIKPHSMDCAKMLSGLQKEFLFTHIFCGHSLEGEELAHYVFERLDDLITGIYQKQAQPLFTQQSVEACLTDEERLAASIEHIKAWILKQTAQTPNTPAIVQALDAICESQKNQQNEIIFKGMYSYVLTLTEGNAELSKRIKQAFEPCFCEKKSDPV